MGANRNGARTFLEVMAKACRLSHMRGFRSALNRILGAETAEAFFAVWEPCCSLVDILIASDDWYNQKDYTNDDGAGEDTSPGV